MRRILSLLIIVIIVNGLIVAQALAANSQTFTIGATIPAIPGVNVPLIEEAMADTSQLEKNGFVMIEEKSQNGGQDILIQTFVSL